MGQNWAITIGINGYRNLPRLNDAKRDAEVMQSFLQQELNIQTVYHFTDDSPAIPQDYGSAIDSRLDCRLRCALTRQAGSCPRSTRPQRL